MGLASLKSALSARSIVTLVASMRREANGSVSASSGLSATGCIFLDDLIVEATPLTKVPDAPKADITGDYMSKVFDSSGDQIATVTEGRIHILGERPVDGHLMDHATEEIAFADGNVHAEGIFDLTKMMEGEWQGLPLMGTSGRYCGMIGVEIFQAIELPVKFHEKIILCSYHDFQGLVSWLR